MNDSSSPEEAEKPAPVAAPGSKRLGVLPYHVAVEKHFRENHPEMTSWISPQPENDAAKREALRLELLKTAVRLDRGSRPELYGLAEDVLQTLGLESPLTLHQAQSGSEMNAALLYVPGEIHVVFYGTLLERLEEPELRAILGHEFTHYKFHEADNSAYGTTDALLDSLMNMHDTDPAQVNTTRNFRLYTEILCDRGALHSCGSIIPAIAMLVKTSTSLVEVDAAAYLKQAQEVFASGDVQTKGSSHPENFIRAQALHLFSEQGDSAEPAIRKMIEGPLRLDDLDILGQEHVSDLTHQLIHWFTAETELQTSAHMAQAHLYFHKFKPRSIPMDSNSLLRQLKGLENPLRDYFCYVLLDFIAVDRDELDFGYVRVVGFFRELGWHERFQDLAGKELGLRKTESSRLKKLLAKRPQQGGSSDE
ncbi:MAG: M48 family metalloprotease [Planctomycetes bacterium]|nr:M48 family metalloprotease [Planctomycetota bacterium]